MTAKKQPEEGGTEHDEKMENLFMYFIYHGIIKRMW